MNATCPSCQQSVDATLATCPTCGWKFNSAGSLSGSIVSSAARPKIQVEVDLGVTIDRTGSSKAFEVGIAKTADIIFRQVAAKARTVKVWLASHGDLDEGQDFCLHTDGGTPDQAAQDLAKISYGGGGDPAEHHLDAIEQLVNTVPWTADPTRGRGAIVAFMTADSKPARSGVTSQQLGEMIAGKGLLLYCVCEPTPTLHELVRAAGGMMFPITNAPDPSELQNISAKLAASIVLTVSKGGTKPMVAPVAVAP